MEGFSNPVRWGDPLAGARSSAISHAHLAIVVAAHAAVGWAVMELTSRPGVRAVAEKIMVQLIESPKPAPPAVKKAFKAPPRDQAPPLPMPLPLATSDNSIGVPLPVPAPSPPLITTALAPMPQSITAARFDADYLSNPKPVYPTASRRLGEEGKVLLRVRVSPEGMVLAIELKKSSGYSRLDDSARAAVERWQFVPAKRGSEPVEAWVVVPIDFFLNTA